MLTETEPAAATLAIPPKKRREEGLGSRKGNGVSVTKWKHRFYKWRVSWIEDGKKQEKGFKLKTEAEEWAETKERNLLNFGVGASLSAEERSAVIDTREDLAAAGLTIREAVAMALEIRRKESRSITVEEMVSRVLRDRESAGRSERYLQDLRSRLGRFKADFGARSLATITRDEITDWIRGLKLGATTQNNFLRVLRVLFNEGVKGKYLDESPAQHVTEAKTTQAEVGTLTPAEVANLLCKADSNLVPTIALGAFAGIRREEIRRLDWRDVDLEQGTIRIRPKNAKSARNRLVPIEKNLTEWLRPYAKSEGRVWCNGGNKRLTRALRLSGFGEPGTETEKEKEAGLKFIRPFPENGLRHSYATHWMATYQDSGALSLHLGHSNSRIVFDHYRAPVAAKVAAAYWSIRPRKVKNVISMKLEDVA